MLIQDYDEIFDRLTFDDSHLCNEEDFLEFAKPPVSETHVQHQIDKCESRRGKLIPFVPLARLISSFQPPERPAPTRDDYPDVENCSEPATEMDPCE
jgi:hypothetical protein